MLVCCNGDVVAKGVITAVIKMGSSCRFIVFLVLAYVYVCEGNISDKRLCGDPSCSDPVSRAKTLIRYSSNDLRILSFTNNVDCTIYSKSAGSRQDLWGAEINGKRGYVPKNFVREYKVLKKSLQYVVDTEETENGRSSEKNVTTEKALSNVSSIDVNDHEMSNLEATLNDVEHSGLEPDPGSGILKKTPSLDDSSTFKLSFADLGLPSFSGSGVAAEPLESETSPKREDITQPFEIVDGTKLYYDTDGEHVEPKLLPPPVQPTFTTLNALPSVIPEQPSKLNGEPTAVPPAPVGELPTSTELPSAGESDLDVEGNEKNVEEAVVEEEGSAGFLHYITSFLPEGSGTPAEGEESKEVDEVPVEVKNEAEPAEKKIESVADKETGSVTHKETKYVNDKEEETVLEPKKEAEASADGIKREAEAIEDEKKENAEEPNVKIQDIEDDTEEEDDYEEDEEEEDDYEEEEEEDEEEEVSVEVTELQSLGAGEPKPMEEVKSEGAVDALKQSDNQEAVHTTLQVDSNINNSSVDNSEADSLNLLEESVKESRLHVESLENLSDVSKSSDKVVTDEPSIPEHTTPLPTSESEKVNIVQTEGSGGSAEELELAQITDPRENVTELEGSAEELELAQITDPRENVTESEGSGGIEQTDSRQVSTNTQDSLHSLAGDDKSVEGLEVIGESGEVIQLGYGNDYLEDISKNLETQYVPVHLEELVPDKMTDHNLGVSSEIKDEAKADSPSEIKNEAEAEEPQTDFMREQVETTTATSLEELYYEIPSHEPETSTAVPTSSSEELVEPVESIEEVLGQEETIEPSGGLFSGFTDSLSAGFGGLTSMFGSSSSDSHISEVPEETNESKLEATTENIPHTDEAEEMGRKREVRENVWSSLWGGPGGEHIAISTGNHQLNEERGRKPSACGANYDPSSGIDSDCIEVAGELPSNEKKPEGVPNNPEQPVIVESPEDDNLTMDLQRSSYDTLAYLIITAVTVLLFSLGHYYIEKKRRDGILVAKINGLEKELLVSSKECLILKDDLQATKERLLSIENCSTDNSEVAAALNLELEESKAARTELEEQVASLEKELEAATEAGLELNHMLSEFLSTQNDSETVMKSVEQLQKQLDSQQITITKMTASLKDKNMENETLQADLSAAKDKISSLEDDMKKVNENLNDVLSAKLKMEEDLLEKNKLLQTQLDEVVDRQRREIDQYKNENDTLQDTVTELKDNLVAKESEITVLQDCLKQLKNVDDEEGEDKLQALLDVGHTKAELKLLTIERDTLAEKLQGEEDARKLLEDHVKVISEEFKTLRGSYEEAEKEKIEAQTRLEVLSNYFKEKETQLQKELGLQEALCLQKEGDATSTYEHIKSLQEEIENYKSQNDTMKKEILDQERGLKGQIATLEKKAHENWVATRQAERKLEDSKQEASQLRNRLTIVEKNATNTSKNGIPGDSNGELPTSPVHMGISALQDSSSSPLHYQHLDGLPASSPLPALIPGQPLPPSPFMGMPPPVAFIPPLPPGVPYMPPPPPLFPGDRRPPPLGRMSSPPPRHYSPPPPNRRGSFSPYDHSPPPSPPPNRYRSPPPHADHSPDRFRQHRSPPPPHYNPYSSPASRPPPHWDDSHGNPRSGLRPLPPPTHRDSPREPKGSGLSSGHSSESLEKSSRHSGRV